MLGSDVIFQTLFYQTYFSTKGTIGHVGQRYDLSNFDLSNMFFHKRDISENLYQFKILVVCFHSYLQFKIQYPLNKSIKQNNKSRY